MPTGLTLDLVKQHLRLPAAAGSEDALLQVYMSAAEGEFLTESKRRWSAVGEPALVEVTDPTTDPPTTRFLGYVDPAVLSEAEQATALSWLLLTVAHKYENRQSVNVGVNVVQVPDTTKRLMSLLREPTL